MLKLLFRNWHRYVLCALLSVIIWAWVFTLLFYAPPKKRIALYADLPVIDGNGLSILLEEDLPDGIRRVEAANLDLSVFDADTVANGDLYLIRESDLQAVLPSFCEIDRSLFPGETFYEADGKTYGILVFDREQGLNTAGDCLFYAPNERYYLLFNKDSGHLGAWNGSPDDAAITVAQHFLKLR
ncbi:MAG: hypothetical protein II412_06720 [Clostridia bacterium]|nr:hypothetical protein [Clostridia bacterium]MBQ2202249.1 hypothetical protein [Clostridia bacterium]